MGPDLELIGRSENIMEASASKENGNVVREHEDKHMVCASNYENTFEMGVSSGEQNEEVHKREDVEVNIVECMNVDDGVLVQAQSQDVTENSSSFGDTSFEVVNGEFGSDVEVVSELHGDAASVLEFGGYGDLFRMRKKQLTSHWRTFIQPLLWRCKWVELQMKKFQSQAIKCDRILEENNQRKQFKLEKFALEGLDAKSMPFSSDPQQEKVMKRKKRKRAEDLMDTAAYMTNHNLFSYFASRISDGASINDDRANLATSMEKKVNGNNEFGVTDELLSLDFRDDDNSLEHLLWKIGVVQSQVSELKTRLNKVMSENADKLNLQTPYNALTSSAQNLASPLSNGDRMPVGSYIASQFMPEYNVGDLVLPESAASSHGEVTHLPDIIESTDQPRGGDSWKTSGDGILVYNGRAKKEMDDFGEVKIHPVQKLQVPKEEHVDLPADDQPTPKLCSIPQITAPKNKRKRARRKAGLGKWIPSSSC